MLAVGALTADEVSRVTARVLRGGGPGGQGFPEPVFDGDFQVVDARIVGGKHLKMQLRATDRADSEPIEAIAFDYLGGPAEDPQLGSGATIPAPYPLPVDPDRTFATAHLNVTP